MAATSRKSLGSVRFDLTEMSPVSLTSLSRRRRSIAAQKVVEANIEENDDEVERLARREQNEYGSSASSSVLGNDRRQSSFSLSSIPTLSATEINNQIAQCIKLSTENKINDKNAFQLKMIDFLVYTLKKQDPNLQMASASLDASAKIYGFRVDKVHSDLLKIIGAAKQDKRDNQHENAEKNNDDQIDLNNNGGQKKKKKKNRQHIISTIDALRGNVETYDPLSLIRCQSDTQTSDMLFQAAFPQHAHEEVAINLYNDVVLDKIPTQCNKPCKILINKIDDVSTKRICPSYAEFKFLDWSPDDEPDESKNHLDENDGEYHFDLDAEIADDDNIDNDVMMDYGEAYEERCDRLAQSDRIENIVDFQEIIANNPNPNATYEYSYFQKSYRIHWAGPSHWKILLNRHSEGSRVIETCRQNAIKKKKEIELSFTVASKNESKIKFGQINKQSTIKTKTTKITWSEDKVTFPQDTHCDLKHFYSFFNRDSDYLKNFDSQKMEVEDHDQINDEANSSFNDDLGISSYGGPDTGENFGDDLEDNQNQSFTQDTARTTTQGGFTGDNLVSVPKLTDKIFIPYSQRAKKIDMRQLKKTMWKNLKTDNETFGISQAVESEDKNIEPKTYSSLYGEIPNLLSKPNADSLSPAIAFVSLLHLANEKNLELTSDQELSDLIIKSSKSNN